MFSRSARSRIRILIASLGPAIAVLLGATDTSLAIRPVFSTSLVAIDSYPYRVTTVDWSDYTSRFTDAFDGESFVNGSVAVALDTHTEVTAIVGWADFSAREFLVTIPEYYGPTPWRDTSAEILTLGAGVRYFPIGNQAAIIRPFVEGALIGVRSRFSQSEGEGESSTFIDSFSRWTPGYTVGGGYAIRLARWLRIDAGVGYLHSGDLGREVLGTYPEADYKGFDRVAWTGRLALTR